LLGECAFLTEITFMEILWNLFGEENKSFYSEASDVCSGLWQCSIGESHLLV
jgi:hypothetical protein